MKSTFYLKRKLFLLTVFLLLVIGQNQGCYGQAIIKARKSFDSLNRIYYTGGISEEDYLDKADSLRDHYLSEGARFSTKELTELLSLYKKIGWGKKKYDGVRKNYYLAFLNSAAMFEQNGAYMYYADKIAQEYKANGERDPFIVVSAKSQIYMEQELYSKVIVLYNQQKPYIRTLPELLRENKIDIASGIDALTFLSAGVIESFIKTNDTVAVYETEKLIYDIGKEIEKKSKNNKHFLLYNDFFMVVTQHFVALFENDHTEDAAALNRLEALKSAYKELPTGFINPNLHSWRADHYLATKSTDSVSVYIKKLEEFPSFAKDHKAKIYERKAKLQALKGDFNGSSKWLTLALEEERKVQSQVKAEMDNLLYAFTEAENTRLELQEAEKAKDQQTFFIVIISAGAALIILGIYLLMVYRSRKAKQQIEELNNTAEMQIIAMEETKHQAVREEQQRLGQDLHDGLSSSLAAVRYQLEALIIDTQDNDLKDKLNKLQNETIMAYEAARNKSHEWFSEGDREQQLSFEKQIRLLTDKALPDNRYQKNIHIDNNSLAGVSTDTRISLLRIVQESITNIIKHAKAKTIEILLYEENDELILNIIDDGIGFEGKMHNKKSMLGLQSIERRTEIMNGKTEIQSSSKGTNIKVFIPVYKT